MVNMTGDYRGDLRCVATHEPSSNTLTTDAPIDNQGKGESFSPTDLVAMALATCVVTTLAIAARKHGVELGEMRFEVTKQMTSKPPRKIARITTTVWVPAEARTLPEGFLQRAAEGCPVHRSLDPAVERPITLICA